jgi:hypothetical protein
LFFFKNPEPAACRAIAFEPYQPSLSAITAVNYAEITDLWQKPQQRKPFIQMIKRILFLAVVLSALAGCVFGDLKPAKEKKLSDYTSSNLEKDFRKMEWILGNWEGESKNQEFYEYWAKENDTLITCVTYQLNENFDTVVTDRRRIFASGNQIFYNNNKARWKMARLMEEYILFRNYEVDSASIIRFRITPTGWLVVSNQSPGLIVEYQLQKAPSLDSLILLKKKEAAEE